MNNRITWLSMTAIILLMAVRGFSQGKINPTRLDSIEKLNGSVFKKKAAARPVPIPSRSRDGADGEEAYGVCGVPFLESQGQWVSDHSHRVPLNSAQLRKRGRLDATGNTVLDTVGEVHTFWVWDFHEKKDYTITAKAERKGIHCYVYLDTTESLSDTVLTNIVNEFDTKIYSTDTQNFGSEWKPGIDNDSLITILIYDIKDDKYYDSSVKTFIVGYFHPKDEHQKSVYSTSNEREMFYMDLNPTTPGSSTFYSALAHEFQHMIHWHHDPDEETWVNEGCSEYASFVNGYPRGPLSDFLSASDNNLIAWEGELADYQQVFLWTAYFAEHYGGSPTIKKLVAEPANGIQGIDSVLVDLNYVDVTFSSIFSDWVIANYLDDTFIAGGKYGYEALDLPAISPEAIYAQLPVALTSATVRGWAADYIEFWGAEDLALNFDGVGMLLFKVRVLKLGEGVPPAVEEIPLDQNQDGTLALPNFGTDYDKAVLIPCLNTYNAGDYSYSAEGTTSSATIELAYDDGYFYYYFPTLVSGDTIRVAFDGINNTVLDSARIQFASTGSVEFHIWDTSRKPYLGRDLITPFILQVSHTTTSRDNINWQTVDLTAYSLDSSQDYFLGYVLGSDAPNPYILADSSESRYLGSLIYHQDPQRGSAWYLAGGDLIFRAYLSPRMNDFTTPEVTAGVLQNPVFSEHLDIYTVAKKPLNPNTVKGSFTLGTHSDTLTMKANNLSYTVFVDDSYILSSSGTATVIVSGTHTRGNIVGYDTLTFEIQLIPYTQGGVIASADQKITLQLPPRALNQDTYLTIVPGEECAKAVNLLKGAFPQSHAVSEAFALGPPSLKLNKPALLTVNYDLADLKAPLNEDKLIIAIFRNGNWVSLGGRVDKEKRHVCTEIQELGVYQLRYDPDKQYDYNPEIPISYQLLQNYPNPFNANTKIRYDLKARGRTSLVIYNLLSQRIKTLVNEIQERGKHSCLWDGTDDAGNKVASGVYIYQLRSNSVEAGSSFSSTKKMILLK